MDQLPLPATKADLGLATSSTDNAAVRFDGTSGNTQNSGVIIDDSNNVSGVGTLGCGAITTTGNFSQTGATTFGTGTGTVTLNGNTTVTTGKTITAVSGIIFSNETLNQYDEGTWTPTIRGDATAGSNTYSAQAGYYTRIGRFVHCAFYVNLTAKDGAMAGNIAIGGLPFTVVGSSNYVSGTAIGGYGDITLGAGYTQLMIRQAVNGTTALLGKGGTAIAFASIVAADIAATSFISGSITYEI